jgi:deazaflavin-dependent oxidoreductase (nitroreductase family)
MSNSAYIERNTRVTEEFRANKGKVRGWGSLILVTAKGAKTGQPHVYPLMSVPYDGGNYLAVGSKGGAPKHPVWYYNLLANPEVIVEDGKETFTATAILLSGAEREKAFAKAATVFPPYAEYQKKTSREIPVFLLKRN